MATSKTLAPTNVTISIPAMADAPDASVFSNCVDKEADAINALNSQLEYKAGDTVNSPTEWCSFAGICKSSKRVLEFTIPLEKYLPSNRTVNVTRFQGYILKNTGGNLHGNMNYINFTGCTVSAQAVNSNFIIVTLKFDSDLDLPNMSSVTFNGTFAINIS